MTASRKSTTSKRLVTIDDIDDAVRVEQIAELFRRAIARLDLCSADDAA